MTAVTLVVLPGSTQRDPGVLRLIATSQLGTQSYIALYWDAVYRAIRNNSIYQIIKNVFRAIALKRVRGRVTGKF